LIRIKKGKENPLEHHHYDTTRKHRTNKKMSTRFQYLMIVMGALEMLKNAANE
jgi:hypothetical protein